MIGDAEALSDNRCRSMRRQRTAVGGAVWAGLDQSGKLR
jgi:hypothetical protein